MKDLVIIDRDGSIDNDASRDRVSIRPGGPLLFNLRGEPYVGGHRVYTQYDLLPHTTGGTAGYDGLTVLSGTNVVVAQQARSVKAGATLTTDTATPAAGEQAILSGIANSAFLALPINAKSQLTYRAQVSIATLTNVFASFGFNENLTDPDPSGTAGEGAMFLFCPSANKADLTVDPTSAGVVAGDMASWIIAEKVNGADVFYPTGVPVNAGQDYELMVVIGANLKPSYYIDGVLVKASASALTDGDLVGAFAGIETRTTAARTFDIRQLEVTRLVG